MKKQTHTWQTHEFGVPAVAGVYCVISYNLDTQKKELLYIGSSKNIRERLSKIAHPYNILYKKYRPSILLTTKSKVCSNYIKKEKELIKRLQPRYNILHKSKPLVI